VNKTISYDKKKKKIITKTIKIVITDNITLNALILSPPFNFNALVSPIIIKVMGINNQA
jgi:hypothetical protein